MISLSALLSSALFWGIAVSTVVIIVVVVVVVLVLKPSVVASSSQTSSSSPADVNPASFPTDGGEYYLQNVGDSQYIQDDGSSIAGQSSHTDDSFVFKLTRLTSVDSSTARYTIAPKHYSGYTKNMYIFEVTPGSWALGPGKNADVTDLEQQMDIHWISGQSPTGIYSISNVNCGNLYFKNTFFGVDLAAYDSTTAMQWRFVPV